MTTYIKPTERILNCIPSRDTEQDWGVENALEAGILSTAQRGLRIVLRL